MCVCERELVSMFVLVCMCVRESVLVCMCVCVCVYVIDSRTVPTC